MKIPQYVRDKLSTLDISELDQTFLITEVVYEVMHELDPAIPRDPTGEIREMLESELHRQVVPILNQLLKADNYGVS